jgi:CubicO group peptidase (beta-lactamase class C family)
VPPGFAFAGARELMSSLKEGVEAAIRSALDEQRVVGGVFVLLRDGEELVHRPFGLADRETSAPMTASSVFRLSSLTKPVVTTAALRLVDDRELDLTSPITRWLPSFRPALPSGDRPDITLHQLLTHTSGLAYSFGQPPSGPYNQLGVSSGLDRTGVSFAQELELIASAPLSFVPGTAWQYSVGIDVLGAVLEAALGEPLPALVASLVTSPLGMTSASFAAPSEGLVTPYADGTPPVRMTEGQQVPLNEGMMPLVFSPSRAFDPASFPSGGAGMNGTADDVVRLLEVVRTGGSGIISPETAAAMMSNRIGPLRTDVEENGGATGFGYGGSVLLDPGRASSPASAGTWSWGGVWGHLWWVDPERKVTAVLMTNTAVEGLQGRLAADLQTAVATGVKPC